MYRVLPEDESRGLGDKLESVWNAEVARSKKSPNYTPSLAKALARVFGPTYAAYGIYAFYEECIVKLVNKLTK
jgi:hypothetical protein